MAAEEGGTAKHKVKMEMKVRFLGSQNISGTLQQISVTTFCKAKSCNHKIAPRCFSCVVQVFGSPKIPDWFENMLVTWPF